MPARDRSGALRVIALAALLATPFALAFRSGGFFDQARLWALLAATAVLALTAIATPKPLPRAGAGRLALAGLWALAAWTAASIGWAPLRGPAFHDFQRLLLYGLSFTSAVALLRRRDAARLVEPVAAAGIVVVIAYGLAGRLLPGIVHETHGAGAGGRLDQPLTYWNAVGALGAIGLVLCTRLAGDGTRRVATRAAAAAACAPLGMGIYLTYSRGALGAAAAGLLVLVAAAPDRRQLRALAVAVIAALLGGAAAAPFPVVASLGAGSRSQGLIALALLAALAAAAGLLERRFALHEAAGRLHSEPLRIRGLRPLAAAGVAAVLVLFVTATAASERRSPPGNPATGATPARLASLQSHRYAYWKVALGAFADHPLNGIGSGGFQVRWLAKRDFREAVQDAHSLYLETAAELGIAGLAALAAFIAGIALAARRTIRRDAALGAGLLAGFVAWASQAGVDWLWEMPAVSLVALLLAAALVAAAEHAPPATRA
jgi:hypothetical protein